MLMVDRKLERGKRGQSLAARMPIPNGALEKPQARPAGRHVRGHVGSSTGTPTRISVDRGACTAAAE